MSLEATEFVLTVAVRHTLHVVDGDSILCAIIIDIAVAVVIHVLLRSRWCRLVSPHSVILCAVQRIGNAALEEAALYDGWIQLLPDTGSSS